MSEPMTSVPVPAAMPREGDVARYRSMVDRVNRMTDDGRLPGEPKRAPSAIDSPHNACCYREQCKSLVARALAAEAALAPLAKIDCQTEGGYAFDPWLDDQVVFGIGADRVITAGDLRRARAAAIRAQGE